MNEHQTAPNCIAKDCDKPSALLLVATDDFFSFSTYYCSDCHEKLRNGQDLEIDTSRIKVERRDHRS